MKSRYMRVNELERDQEYEIVNFSFKDTKFGTGVIATISDQNSEELISVFIPSRFANLIKSEKDLEDLNKVKLNLCYRGTITDIHNVEFIPKQL